MSQGGAPAVPSVPGSRTVHAFEPIVANIRAIERRYANRTNLKLVNAGLGSTARRWDLNTFAYGAPMRDGQHDPRPHFWMGMLMNAHKQQRHANSSNSVPVYRLDDLFRNEALAFAHFDVGGAEADVLRGAAHVLARDRPIFTTELHVKEDPAATHTLLTSIADHSYEALLLDEECGGQWESHATDCRTLINVPRERASVLRGRLSDAAAAAGARLFSITDASALLATLDRPRWLYE